MACLSIYQGMLERQAVDVKKLKEEYIDDKTFSREVRCLTRLKPHNNIVRFLGYYSGAEQMCVRHEGTSVIADHTRHRLLCFEYQPDSLYRRISGRIICSRITLHMIPIVSGIQTFFSISCLTDASSGLGWIWRYQIIKGICIFIRWTLFTLTSNQQIYCWIARWYQKLQTLVSQGALMDKACFSLQE